MNVFEMLARKHWQEYQVSIVRTDASFVSISFDLLPKEARESLIYAMEKTIATTPGTKVVPEGTTFGYSLAMRVLQSSLYDRLDEDERAECDEILTRHRATQKEKE